MAAVAEDVGGARGGRGAKAEDDESDGCYLRCRCLTFNVATYPPPSAADPAWRELLGEDSVGDGVDIVAVGLQEVHSRADKLFVDLVVRGEDDWTAAITRILAPKGFKRIRTLRTVGIVLSIFVQNRHLLHLREIETSYKRLSFMGWVGVKGAVIVRLRLYGVTMCFVNAHLSAHDNNLETRVAECEDIIENVVLKYDGRTSNILYHDYVTWMGDLNFRLKYNSFTFEEVTQHLARNDLGPLLEQDELNIIRREERAMHELDEATPTFAPTYKFRIGTDEYNNKRRPGWTDRILYRCNVHNYENMGFPLEMSASGYRSHMGVRCSDHKPVSVVFDFKCFAREEARRYDLPAYGPIITFRTPDDWKVGCEGVISYVVELGKSAYLNQWDWIGLFRADFTSLEDYLTFTWSSLCRLTAVDKHAYIMDSSLTFPGKFRLMYFGHKNCVLGISDVFDVTYPDDVPVEVAEEALAAFEGSGRTPPPAPPPLGVH